MYKELFKKIGYLIVINIILISLCEWWLRKNSNDFFIEDYSFRESIRYFEKAAHNADIIFLGNSQICDDINPDRIKINGYNIYNFGFPGEGIGQTYYKIKYYLERGYSPKLKLVVLQINGSLLRDDPLAGYYNYSDYYDYWDIFQKNSFISSVNVLFNSIDFLRTHSLWPNNIKRLILGKIDHKDFVKVMDGDLLSSGYYSMRTILTPEGLQKEHFNLKTSAQTIKPRVESLVYYRSLIQLFRKYNIKTVFVHLPTVTINLVQQKKADPEDYSKLLERGVFDIVKTQFPGTPLFDYVNLDQNWKMEYFMDHTHLNYLGAEFLGRQITRDSSLYEMYIKAAQTRPSL